jgi:hypothetical protein
MALVAVIDAQIKCPSTPAETLRQSAGWKRTKK